MADGLKYNHPLSTKYLRQRRGPMTLNSQFKIKKMARKADIDFSLRRDDNPDEHQQKEQLAANLAVARSPKDKAEYVIFKLVDTKKRGRVHIHNVDDVLDLETGNIRRMRVLIGVQSLWLDEQKTVTEDYAKQNRPYMTFEDRYMRVPAYNKTVIEFLRKCSHCVDVAKRRPGSKTEYFEWNPIKQEEEALKKELLEIEVIQTASTLPYEKLKKHAAFMGVSFTDELGEPRTENGIRTYYIMAAKRNPARFKETLGSKQVEVSWMVKRAVIDAKIDLGRQQGTAHFSAGGLICHIPAARNAVEYMIELAMTNSEEGKDFLKKLQEHTT